jgi:hypothetical protein
VFTGRQNILAFVLLIAAVGLCWLASKSVRTGVAQYAWGIRHARKDSPALYWMTIALDIFLALACVVLAFQSALWTP